MTRESSRRWFFGALAATLAFRFWLAAAFPFTPDEAYFALWGRYPALGYYDHPPMIGWWLAALGRLSEGPWTLRLAATLLPALSALFVRALLQRWKADDPPLADWAGACVLLLPTGVWNVLITTDTPLAFFALASLGAFAWAAGIAPGWLRACGFLAAGVLLGLAFTSKYFAVLLGVAYFAWTLCARTPGRGLALGMVILGSAPFVLLNLYWNYEACWCNVMFNLFNRHERAGWSIGKPALYVLTLAYVAGPLLYFAWRARARLRAALSEPRGAALLGAWAVPFALFALLSLYVRIGLHWLLLFLPALVLSVAYLQGSRALAVSARILAGFAALHAVLAVAAALAPAGLPGGAARFRAALAFLTHTDELLRTLEREAGGFELASNAYASAAVLSYHSGRNVPVFGMGSSHARQDDFLTDWRAYAGKNIVIVQRGDAAPEDYVPYFSSVQFRTLAVGGITLHAILGRGFDYAKYRAGVLERIRARYYRIPPLLPVKHCVFCERYFDSATCRS